MANITQSLDLELSSSQFAEDTAISSALKPTGVDICWEGWIKLESLPSTNAASMLLFDTSDHNGTLRYGYQVFLDTNDDFNFWYANGDGGNGGGGNSWNKNVFTWAPSTGVWYHLAVNLDISAGSSEWFLDGVSQGSTTGTRGLTSIAYLSSELAVGATTDNFGGHAAYFDGKISLFRLWSNTLRSATDYSNNWCAELGATTNLAGEWSFDGDALDSSGNSNDLTLVNSPSYASDVPATCSVAGPTTVKTWDGVTQSTGIKTYLGVTVANTKSVIGAT